MRFDEWLDAEQGRTTRIAEFFGVSKSAVSQWRANGVPVAKIHQVHAFTDGVVSLQELLLPRAERARQQQAAWDGRTERRKQMA